MSRRGREPAGAGSAIAVELAIDDPVLSDRIRSLILEHPDLRLIEPGGDAAAEVIITDGANMRAAEAALVAVTDRSSAMDALQAGAAAVLSPRTHAAELHAAVRAAAAGLTALASDYRDLLHGEADGTGGLEAGHEELPAAVDLTPREHQVLQLLAQGASNKVIARRLEITPHTAKFHVASIVAKLAASGRTDAVAKALRLGLVMI